VIAKLCSTPGCSGIRGRCPEHPIGGSWPDRPKSAAYRGSWPRIRAGVLRDQPTCQLCDGPATDVDHIMPLSRGGTHDRSNLRSLCGPCHRRVTGETFGWGARKARR
jgi:5-methylcytosine-specific restriction protein A